jgi:hypothetical protein
VQQDAVLPAPTHQLQRGLLALPAVTGWGFIELCSGRLLTFRLPFVMLCDNPVSALVWLRTESYYTHSPLERGGHYTCAPTS